MISFKIIVKKDFAHNCEFLFALKKNKLRENIAHKRLLNLEKL